MRKTDFQPDQEQISMSLCLRMDTDVQFPCIHHYPEIIVETASTDMNDGHKFPNIQRIIMSPFLVQFSAVPLPPHPQLPPHPPVVQLIR